MTHPDPSGAGRPASDPARPPARTPGRPGQPRDDSAKTTPEADLQPDDASSANTPSADLGDAPRAARAMKQEHKTSHGR